MAKKQLDVWLKFDTVTDEIPTYEANTFQNGSALWIEWYHNDVGVPSIVPVTNYVEAESWYARNGFQDFSS